jgi:hypothetical protein
MLNKKHFTFILIAILLILIIFIIMHKGNCSSISECYLICKTAIINKLKYLYHFIMNIFKKIFNK